MAIKKAPHQHSQWAAHLQESRALSQHISMNDQKN
jgi:hypothetical protein